MHPSVEEIADILGVTTNPDVYSREFPTEEGLDRIRALVRIKERPLPIWASFAAFYLPSFLHRIYYTICEPPDHFEELYLFHALLGRVVDSPEYGRFVRENQRKAALFWLIHLGRISLYGIGSFHLDSDLTQPVPSMLILTFTLISHAFSRHAFVGTPLPAVKIEFQERLQNISVDLIRVQNHTAPGPSSVDLENGASLLLALSAGKRVTMVQDLEEGAHSHWNTCDALEMGGKLNGRCVKSEEGEEMMACGRCRAVRYCSREHQRLHWKQHKVGCFPPKW